MSAAVQLLGVFAALASFVYGFVILLLEAASGVMQWIGDGEKVFWPDVARGILFVVQAHLFLEMVR